MRTVYEAANAFDAQVVKDMLTQQGIDAEVLGAYLQGGAGELPVGGLVRVAVHEADHDAARHLIGEWQRLPPLPDDWQEG